MTVDLHGITLDAEDALDITRASLDHCADALDTVNTFHGYEVAACHMGAALRQAISLGFTIDELVTFTGLPPAEVLDLLVPVRPFTTSEGS
jgi:hypothetical protein